jgi:hypothetical protein
MHTYIVTIAMQSGPAATVTVLANSKADAEYRAAMKVEARNNGLTSHVIACRRA